MPRREMKYAVTVFSSYGTSLETWQKAGMLGRETGYLRMLQDELGPLALVKYGSGEDEARLAAKSGLSVVTGNRLRLPRAVYSLAAPVSHWNLLRRSAVFRTNQLRGAWTAALASMLHRRPLLLRTGYVWSHFSHAAGGSGLRGRLVLWLERFALRRAAAVAVASVADRDFIMHRHGVPAGRIHVVPNPVDTGLFSPLRDSQPVPGLVSYVGRLEAQKGVDLLIEAVSQIPGARLRIIGDGSLRPQLEDMAAGRNVEFMGTVANEDLPALLRESAVFVLPSLYEGTPKSLLEAMACGVAVVATRAPGNESVLVHGETGLLVERTPEAVREAVIALLSDAALRSRLGSAASQYVRERHSMRPAAVFEASLIRRLARENGIALPVEADGHKREAAREEAREAA